MTAKAGGEGRFRAIVNAVPAAALVLDDAGRVVARNAAAEAAADLNPEQFAAVADAAAGDDGVAALGDRPMRLAPLGDGHLLVVLASTAPEREASGRDEDPLTGLGDRRRLQRFLERASRNRGGAAALLLLDLDRFKPVNDTLGHPIGDALLKVVANRIRACVRDSDDVIRIGGDEFAVALEDGRAPEALGGRLVEALARPYLVHGHMITISASIGIALMQVSAGSPADLHAQADLALYAAKRAGGRRARVFVPEMAEQARMRRALEMDLRRALALGQFELHFQPQIRLNDGGLTGFEALLRWRHPEHGLISPSQFIGLAEEVGIIVPIGEWVLRTACVTAAGWPLVGGQPLVAAVNVSCLQFDDPGRLLRAVEIALCESGLAPRQLEIEITESAILHDTDTCRETLESLRLLGVRLAMDDFGTGYSSLSQLRTLPFDRIKIDRSFVSAVAEGNEASAMIRTIAALGVTLGMCTVAEGVETPGQAAQVAAEGCTHMQGFLVSRPLPAREAADLIERFMRAAAVPA